MTFDFRKIKQAVEKYQRYNASCLQALMCVTVENLKIR